jgi:phosphate acyltransferase
MIKVALDAMGGDNAPVATIEGAVQAVQDVKDLEVVLTGPKAILEAELAKLGTFDRISIVDAPQEVEMDESPASILKTKPESGLVKCVALQKSGEVSASVSAGNSGAMMAACLMILGRTGGISRPAIVSMAPSMKGFSIMLDCGANVDEKPQQLVDFAICGEVFAHEVLKIESPKIGLLNIGEESKKGPETVQETHKLLQESDLNFIGNIEGHDVVRGTADVIVTSGFTGNIVLKLMEGFGEAARKVFATAEETPLISEFHKNWNYETYGGALLLGLKGSGFIAHGRSTTAAITSAIKTAHLSVANEVAEKIAQKMAK